LAGVSFIRNSTDADHFVDGNKMIDLANYSIPRSIICLSMLIVGSVSIQGSFS